MRDLTEEELDLISGGGVYGGENDNEDIVVTGPRSHFPPSYHYGDAPSGGGSGGGGGSQTYTPGVTQDADKFSKSHLVYHGSDPEDAKFYSTARADIAKLYDFTHSNPNAIVQLGDGKSITGAQVFNALSRITVNLVDIGGGATGALTQPTTASGPISIVINASNPNVNGTALSFNDVGRTYQLFHEYGHALNYIYNTPNYANEASANTTSRSLAKSINVNALPIEPRNGYN